MSERETIEQVLGQARLRRRLQRAFNGLAEGTALGAAVFLVVLVSYKLLPIPSLALPIAGGVAVACALLGAFRRAWRADSLVQTARWLDHRSQLKERLSTALEVADQRASEEWKRLILADAASHARALDVRQLSRFDVPKVARWALLLAVLAAGLGFVPEYRSKAYVQRQQDAAVIQDAGRHLAELTRRELAQKPPVLPAVQKSIEQVAELGDQLGRQKLTKAEALKDLASVTEKLARQEQEIDQAPGFKRLEQAARQPGNAANATPEALQKQIDALQKSLGNAADKGSQLDKLSRDLQKLQQQASKMAGNDGQAGDAARQQLAQSLDALAQQAKEAGASLDGLEQAIQALQSNNIDQFIKDLDLASHDLDQLREMAKSMQQLQQQLTKLGKDLGEQLKYGQAQAAIQTLEKMAQQLKAANPSAEQLQKILEELKKAAGPAEEYGKVADHLKQAAQQAQDGNNAEAAKNLAAAQDELKKLLEQMQDAEGLQAALAALERAQMAVATGTMWSQVSPGGQCTACNGGGCANCNGTGRRWGHGGKPGQGVGTWADEYGWTYFNQPQQAGWDNSGIQRPDMDPKGLTERPTELNPNLMPDKVKGRMSPGNSMPSITLKGVSIKGTSNVKFEEAATAAQAEAQSALNQDQVPRAYQNAVRDYFDDLKR